MPITNCNWQCDCFNQFLITNFQITYHVQQLETGHAASSASNQMLTFFCLCGCGCGYDCGCGCLADLWTFYAARSATACVGRWSGSCFGCHGFCSWFASGSCACACHWRWRRSVSAICLTGIWVGCSCCCGDCGGTLGRGVCWWARIWYRVGLLIDSIGWIGLERVHSRIDLLGNRWRLSSWLVKRVTVIGGHFKQVMWNCREAFKLYFVVKSSSKLTNLLFW